MAYIARHPAGPAADIAEPREKWYLFVALGVALLIVGLLAFGNVFAATLVSIYYIGALMLIGGVGEIIHAFSVQHWSGFFGWLLSGIAYSVAGVLAFTNPLLASSIMTLLLAISLIVSGAFRIWIGFEARPASIWGWIVAGGVLTLLTGVAVALAWPGSSLWVLGLILAIDLTMQGIAAIAFGMQVRPQQG